MIEIKIDKGKEVSKISILSELLKGLDGLTEIKPDNTEIGIFFGGTKTVAKKPFKISFEVEVLNE